MLDLARDPFQPDEASARGSERPDAKRLHLLSHEANGARLLRRVQTRAYAQANARARRFRGKVHDGLHQEVSRELVQESETLSGTTRIVA